jgi:hypothetical protein
LVVSQLAERTPHRRGRWLSGAIAGLLLLAAVAVVLANRDGRNARKRHLGDTAHATSLAIVTRGSLFSQLTSNGTLTYATQSYGSPYTIVNQESGTFSALPLPGRVISRGQVVYRVSNRPVILLYGSTPVYRSIFEGAVGPDVQQLNENLVALGCATRSELSPSSDYFGVETADALDRLQERLGEEATGSLEEGQAVFLPGRIRIASIRATLGTRAARALPIALATATRREVVTDLDASDQTEVAVGDRAEVTLPTGRATPGVVSAIGTVIGSGASGPTVPVYIKLERSGAAGRFTQTPVQVAITTATIKRAMIVPVDALLARPDGRYAIETVNPGGLHELVGVTLGTFDDADGSVQVAGSLRPGERIVVPDV